MNKNSLLNSVIQILRARAQDRSVEDTEVVKRYLLGLQFCKKLKLKDKHISELLPNFKVLSAYPHQEIVRFGDIGDKFYITLKGGYAVWVPVLHTHILHFLEECLREIEGETDQQAKQKIIKSLNFKFKHLEMPDRPKQKSQPVERKETLKDGEDSPDYESEPETAGEQEKVELYHEDDLVVFVLSKCVQMLKEEGHKPKQFDKDDDWSINTESFEYEKPLQIRMLQLDHFWAEFVRLFVKKTGQEPNLKQKGRILPCFSFQFNEQVCELNNGHFFYRVGLNGPGSAFGELALLEENHNRRAASCIATERSELIYLEKVHFKESLQRLQVKALKKRAEFLQRISLFQSLNSATLMKSTYLLHKVKLIRNQKVYQEGDLCSKVYIVYKGEFELKNKLLKKQPSEVEKISGIYQGSRHVSFAETNILAKKLPEITDLPQSLRLCIYGPGSLVGEEDVMQRNKHACSLTCYSSKGTIFELSKESFLQLIQMKRVRRQVEERVSQKNQQMQISHLSPRSKNQTDSELKDEKYMKNDFSVLDPVGYVRKQQEKLRMRRLNQISSQLEDRKLSLPTLSPRFLSPGMSYPSANKHGMFAKTTDEPGLVQVHTSRIRISNQCKLPQTLVRKLSTIIQTINSSDET